MGKGQIWYHVRFEGPIPPETAVKQFVTKADESETEEWMRRPPASAPAAIQPPPLPIPLAPIPPSPSPPPPPAYLGLRRELAQLNKDLENLPLGGTRTNPASAFPVREVANGTNAQGNPVTVFVAVPIKPTELRELKRTLPKLHENAHEVAEQLELFLEPSENTYPELMYILGHLFTPEERNLIRRAPMAAWDRRQAGQQAAVAADMKFPIADPNWNLNDAGHREHMRDMKRMILEGIKLAIPQGKNLTKAFEGTAKTKQKSQIMIATVQTAVKNEVRKERETRPVEQKLGWRVRLDTIPKDNAHKKLYVTRVQANDTCYQHTCNLINLTFPVPQNWLTTQTWKGYQDDYGLGIDGTGSDPGVVLKILISKHDLDPIAHSLFHSYYEEMRKVQGMTLPPKAQNMFLALAETIAK
ncbi:hypothetical protein E2320_019125 [Naja naja]|nr:hypothetical protein E2320_019125 [Naja naja]